MRFRVLLVAVLTVLLTGPVRAADPAAPPAAAPLAVAYTQFTLPNGLQVILHEDHRVPMITTNIWYHVGSDRELPGRTGFAHLFEHLMFMGSGHVKLGEFDNLLERTGGDNNASTSQDRTNYWINAPSSALSLALYLEADRMGYLLDAMSPKTVDAQRDVVKNERRQSYENRPYGVADLELPALLYPPDHPYHWPTIGNMADLSAASYADVVAFFKRYYSPNNASLVVAGDLDPAATRTLVEHWFSTIPSGTHVPPLAPPAAELTRVITKTVPDRVELPRLYLAWLTPPLLQPGDAALDVVSSILADGKNSRLYKRLVYDLQIAQNVFAFQSSQDLSSTFEIIVTPRPGHTIAEVKKVVDEELDRLRREPPTPHEVERAVNQIEASFYDNMERVGGFGGVADLMNSYYTETGDPDYFNEDLARYRALDATDIQAAVRRWLPAGRRVELTVVPAKPAKP